MEEVIDADHITYWLHDDRLEAEHHAFMIGVRTGRSRILTIR